MAGRSGWQDSYAGGPDQSPLMRLAKWLNWSLYVGRPFGFRTRLHWSVLILPAIFALPMAGSPAWTFFPLLIAYFILFDGSVFLHEVGHAYTARRLRYPVDEILLYILGGLAITTGGRRNPNDESAVVAFGPFVSFVLVAVFAAIRWLIIGPIGLTVDNGFWVGDPRLSFQFLAEFGFWLNLTLGVFNLIPLFPLDGSWLLRAFMAMNGSVVRATMRVAHLGIYFLGPAMMVVGVISLVVPRDTSGLGALNFGNGGLLLLVFGLLGIMTCRQVKRNLQFAPVYTGDAPPVSAWEDDSAGFGAVPYGGYASDSGGDGKKKKSKPGFWTRRALMKMEREGKKAEEERERMDALLEKISREGIGALTKRERDFMNRASKRTRDDE
jgi:Zn-dependent protease